MRVMATSATEQLFACTNCRSKVSFEDLSSTEQLCKVRCGHSQRQSSLITPTPLSSPAESYFLLSSVAIAASNITEQGAQVHASLSQLMAPPCACTSQCSPSDKSKWCKACGTALKQFGEVCARDLQLICTVF